MSFRIKSAVVAAVLALSAVGCQDISRVPGGGRVLAEAAGRKLHLREVREALPRGMSGADSAAFMERYVAKWVRKQLKLQEAEQLFSGSERDIDSLVEAYRESLLIRKLEQHLVDSRLDTLVTDEQVSAYYAAHASEFKAPQTLVKGRVVRFDSGNRQAAKLLRMMSRGSASAAQDFADLCRKNNFTLDDFTSSWVTFTEFLSYLPVLHSRNYDALLVPGRVQQMNDSRSGYYFEITEVLHPGDVLPLDRVGQTIRRILSNQRQNDIIRSYDEELYERALAEGGATVYNDENR
ncbi:MAG: peptidyl-prolyl cis-trans isomerase [Alistipes sp.]|nr:peptidyl-prolyl cis-trans isomerase [Alistipes sp.]MDE7070146.1 peptidyl-prolyl cis-trans isomerase [Alistipes sp.]